MGTASLMLSSTTLSVNSSFSRVGSAPVFLMAARTCSTKSGWWNCRALTLTASCSSRANGSVSHALIWAQAVSSTHCPMERMSPVSSASGMNCSGETKPRSGCSQRSNTSAPMGWFWALTCIWKKSLNCCWESALRRSASSAARASSAACMSGSKKRRVLRPEFLAWYIAVSACLNTSSMPISLSRNKLMPMLAELKCSNPWRLKGQASEARTFSPISWACTTACWLSSFSSSRTMTNSSPPIRATVSLLRTQS